MQFNILVTGSVYSSQSAYSAWRFCQAAISAGHTISQVFFYQDGVSQASSLAVPIADEFNAVEAWVGFAEQTSCPLVVCVSAAERRGILNAEQANEFSKKSHNLHPAFQIAGLGVLHEAMLAESEHSSDELSSQRMVTFK